MKNLISCRVNIMVANMDEALNFYQNKLGLKLLSRYGNHYAEVQAADLMIGLHPSSKKVITGNNMSIGLGVTDFDATFKGLSSMGIEIKIEQDGWIRLAHFADPDGNPLFLAERKE